MLVDVIFPLTPVSVFRLHAGAVARRTDAVVVGDG